MKNLIYTLFSICISQFVTAQVSVTDLYELADASSFTLKWSDASGANDGYLVIVRASSDLDGSTPSGDGSSYTARTTYASGSSLASGYVTYVGSGTEVTITNVTAQTQYYVQVYSRSGVNWSGATSLNFWYNPAVVGEIYISEYARNSNSEYGYVEIYNSSANIVNLSGCKIISSGSNNQVVDLRTDLQESEISVPAGGFLILCRDRSKSGFEGHWGVDLDLTGYSVNYNRTNINAFGNKNQFTIKLGGTEGVDDGTSIDASTLKPSSTSKRAFQLPIGYWDSNESDNTSATPGSFDDTDNFTKYSMVYVDAAWHIATGESFTKPSASTGSESIKISDTDVSIDNGAVVADIYIDNAQGIALTTQSVSCTNLTIQNNGYVKITSTGSLSVSGTSTVNRTGYTSTNDYNLWGSPLSSDVSITSTFSDANPCDIYVLKASTQEWKHDYTVGASVNCNGNNSTITANNVIASPEGEPDGNFDVGRGYFIVGATSNDRSFSASSVSLNNGTINIPVYGSNGPTVDGSNDWNLLSNPYPSAINSGTFLTNNSSLLQDAIYVYNPSGTIHTSSSYTTYNSSDNFDLASCQGFFVDASTSSTGNLGNVSFTNSMRTSNNSNFRSNTNWHGVYVSITNGLSHSDQTRMYFSPQATEDFDRVFDAHKIMNEEISIASICNNSPLVFNGLPELENTPIEVPLVVKTNQTSPILFQLDSLVKNPNVKVILEDRVANKFTELNKETYSIVLSPNTYINRFYLHAQTYYYTQEITPELVSNFTQKDTTQGPPVAMDQQFKVEFELKLINNRLVYSSAKKTLILDEFTVTSINGAQVMSAQPKLSSGHVNLGHLSNGVYLVTAYLNNGQIINNRFVIQP